MTALNGWLEAPFHAIGMLRAGLREVALYASGSAGLDVLSGLSGPPATSPVLFPGNGVTTNLTWFGGELPDPLQTCGWNSAGLGLIVLLPHPPGHVSARLTSSQGKVESSAMGTLCVVDRLHYHSTDPVYGPTGKSILVDDNAVLLFPKAALVKSTYHVTMTDPPNSPITWSFTVVPGAD